MAMNKVKINSDVELKDRLVAINRQRYHWLGSWQGR